MCQPPDSKFMFVAEGPRGGTLKAVHLPSGAYDSVILLEAGSNPPSPTSTSATYALYRSSVARSMANRKFIVATFDVDVSTPESYNRQNCEIARSLFQGQPGVTVRYWCERTPAGIGRSSQ